jgi:hypothetical protein
MPESPSRGECVIYIAMIAFLVVFFALALELRTVSSGPAGVYHIAA